MFEVDSEKENMGVLKVACIGGAAGYWKNNMPAEAQQFLLEVGSIDATAWSTGVDVGFIVADSREGGAVDAFKAAIDVMEKHGAVLFPMLISDGSTKLDVPFMNIDINKFADEGEIYDYIYMAVKSTHEIVDSFGLVMLDLGDLRTIFAGNQELIFEIGESTGKKAAKAACEDALRKISSLWGDLSSVKGVLLNVVGREDNMSMFEVNEASEALTDCLDSQVNIIWGATVNDSLGDKIRVCLWMAR